MTTAPNQEYNHGDFISFDDISPLSAMEDIGFKVKDGDRGYPNVYYLLLTLFASVLKTSIEAASKALRETGFDVPSADALLKNLAGKTVKKLETLINRVLYRLFRAAWIPGVPATISMDFTDILYYGQVDDDYVTNTKPRKGTHYAYKFLTVSIVSKIGKFVLYVKLVRRGDDIARIVRGIVGKLKKTLRVKWIVLDKGFYKARIVYVLKKEGVPFIIAAPSYEAFERYFKGVKNGYIRYKVAGKYPVWLVKYSDSKGAIYYITNRRPFSNHRVRVYHRRYKRRWRIEVTFRMIKSFMAVTTSKNPVVRLFFFGFSVIVYNLFIASNFKWLKPEEKAKLGIPRTGTNFTIWLLEVLITGIIKIAY